MQLLIYSLILVAFLLNHALTRVSILQKDTCYFIYGFPIHSTQHPIYCDSKIRSSRNDGSSSTLILLFIFTEDSEHIVTYYEIP